MEKIIFFDTETTGKLPERIMYGKRYTLSPVECYNEYPRICQISWKVVDDEKDYIILPDGWSIPDEAAKIHGITTERARALGVPFTDAIREFLTDASQCDRICAHNIHFDAWVIAANIVRSLGRRPFENRKWILAKERQIDTMTAPEIIKFVGARFPDGKPGKFPRLEELYARLFPGQTYNAHNSMNDVRALARCYYECKNIKLI